ncbi:putative phage protein [Aeromonas phage Aes508]|uniref:Putative phage protein n=1 Tax=Aeromonas phage Aes508 TaxID=1198013 RepID=J7KLG1_9CAUD|nr:hypothetical protein F484_gp081 [Aeromonas phage Aes508]AFQ97164.1 putative phage protein [Aeromonas phage Aes508]
MKRVNEMPKNGQFVVVWVYDGKLWSETWRWNDGVVEIHDIAFDEWRTNDCYYDDCYEDLELNYSVV